MAAKKKAAKKTRKKAKKKAPAKIGVIGPEHRDKNMRFAPGNPGGPGRKPGIKVDFRDAVRRRAEELGVDLKKELGTMAMLLLKKAKDGDVSAAKFVADRLCGLLVQEHEITSNSTVHVADQAREDLRKIMKDGKTQSAVLDELQRRSTNGTAKK